MSAAVLVASGAGQAPAGAAEDWAPPVLTSPAPDTLLVGTVELTATSESPYVVFELSGWAVHVVHRAPVGADEDGVFRDTLPTVGIAYRFRAQARACSDATLESCTTASDPVVVQGPWPKLERTSAQPSWVIDPAVVDKVSLRVSGLGGLPATVGGDVESREVRDGDLVEVDVSRMSSGRLVVSLQQCSPLNALACTKTGLILTVRRAPDLNVWGRALFVSPNGDAFWETTTAMVQLDQDIPVTARWRIVSASGAAVAGPYEFSAAELDQGTRTGQSGVEIVIDLRKRLARPLPAGQYRFEVETTANVPGFTKSARKSVPLVVSKAAPITRLTPSTPFFYPFAAVGAGSRVPTTVTMREVDPYEGKFGGFHYRILRSDGQPLGGSTQILDTRGALTWNGQYWRDGLRKTAPAGTYRIELIRVLPCVHDVCEKVYGPVSTPFTLRAGTPRPVDVAVKTAARSTWRRTAAKRNARVKRLERGALRFERKAAHGAGMVKTVHSVRLPDNRDRDSWVPFRVRLRGSWGNADDVRVAVISPQGKTVAHPILTRSRRSLTIDVSERWVRADGRLRLKVTWKGKKPARLDRFVIRYRTYDLTS